MDVREAALADIDAIVVLIETRRQQLADWEPNFWRKADASAEMSKAFLPTLVEDPASTLLVAYEGALLEGCLQFKPTFVPPVYDPGGTTWMIDDFVVAGGRWDSVGIALLAALKARTTDQLPGQLIFPVPFKDDAAMDFFKQQGLSPTTMWWTMNGSA